MTRSYAYSNREYYDMVRFYILSGNNLSEARRLYDDPQHMSSLRAFGIVDPQVPRPETILATVQRLLDHGQFRAPVHAQGAGALRYLRGLYYQHDGCPAHYERSVRGHLNAEFPNRWIGRGSPTVEWPPRSPDLTPLDFYLWSEVKKLVYAEESQNLQQLKRRIIRAFKIVKRDRETLNNLRGQSQKRARLCISEHGKHFEQLL